MRTPNELEQNTIVACDLFINTLVHNLHAHNPNLAQALKIDLMHAAKRAPDFLPNHPGVTDILNKWATALDAAPTSPNHDLHS